MSTLRTNYRHGLGDSFRNSWVLCRQVIRHFHLTKIPFPGAPLPPGFPGKSAAIRRLYVSILTPILQDVFSQGVIVGSVRWSDYVCCALPSPDILILLFSRFLGGPSYNGLLYIYSHSMEDPSLSSASRIHLVSSFSCPGLEKQSDAWKQ